MKMLTTHVLILSLQGTLVVYKTSQWAPVCTSSFSQQLLNKLCTYMGWPGGLYSSLVDKEKSGLQVVEDSDYIQVIGYLD